MELGEEGRLDREDGYIYLHINVCMCECVCVYSWLFCVVVQWKPAQHCNYPPMKKKKIELFPNSFDQESVISLKQ